MKDAASEEAIRERASPADRGPAPANDRGRLLHFPEVLSEVDDASIVRILLDGDERAPRVVWKRFAPMVLRMLKRAFGPEHDIDDLAQEVFLVLFERVHTLREPKALKAFVIAITAHTIRYELRRKAATRWLRFGEPAVATAADVDLDSREALVRLYRILDRLRTDDRTAFVLRFIEGLELADVSQAMDVSIATTKRRLTHAWQRVAVYAERDPSLVEYMTGLAGSRAP